MEFSRQEYWSGVPLGENKFPCLFQLQAADCIPRLVAPSGSWIEAFGLHLYGAPLQEHGAPVSQADSHHQGHILHHLGVQPPLQRASPVCIFLEAVKEGMFIYSIK